HNIPTPLKEQLAEGGRMIIPVGEGDSQYLVLLRKSGGRIIEQKTLPVRFVPMIREDGSEY
ncbi:MAG: protein-L-isoaspartate O-methyltransferase family protein, partial [Bacteroidota bacterium]